jgi:uncharacterized protein YggE
MIRFSRTVLGLAAVALSLALAGPARGDTPVRKVTVVGNATIKVVPDEMLWTVQVSINDSTLARAKARHDASLDAALKYVKGLGNAVKDLQTGGIRIDKNLYPGDNSEAQRNPFSCSTQCTFTLTDFDQYGPMVDALAKLDGFQVESVDYASSKEDATRREALKEALLDAHDKAGDLAATAGCSIDRPLEIIEGTPDNGPRPMVMETGAARGFSATPAAVPGQIEISAAVTATYDLYSK